MTTPNDPAPSPNAQAFVAACEEGDEARVLALLQEDPALVHATRESGHLGWTALHAAARAGHARIVRLLLERGAEVNFREAGDITTPLHWAAAGHHVECVRALLAHGADVHGTGDAHALDVIGWATFWDDGNDGFAGRNATLAELLAAGAEHHVFSAIDVGDLSLIRSVVGEHSPELDRTLSKFDGALTPLHYALKKRRHDILSLLLELGANTGTIDGRGDPPLIAALREGDHEGAKLLQAAGATIPGVISPAVRRIMLSSHAPTILRGSVMLPVPDVAATLAWYTSIGFTEVARYGEGGVLNFGLVRFGNAEVMFTVAAQLGEPKPSLWFYTDFIDALYASFRARQLHDAREAFLNPPGPPPTIVFETYIYDPFYGGREFALRDLNGYILNFHQPAET